MNDAMREPIQVLPGLYRGPRRPPSELFPVHSSRLFVIRNLLDLETGKKLIGDGSPLDEAIQCDLVGMRAYSHPLGTIFPPTLDELRQAVAFIKLKRIEGIYVHCKHGVDRTGMVIASYRIIEQRWSVEDAIDEMMKHGFHRIYFYWLPQLWRLK